MLTGTISDYDADGQFGVIDADDGRLFLFNLSSVKARHRDPPEVGIRVTFAEQNGRVAPHAVELSRLSQPDTPGQSN
jgi:cold shock CspA family protein